MAEEFDPIKQFFAAQQPGMLATPEQMQARQLANEEDIMNQKRAQKKSQSVMM